MLFVTIAVEAAEPGDTVELLRNVTVDTWQQVWNIKDITLEGNGCTLKVNAIASGENHDALFHSAGGNSFNNLVIDLSDIAEPSHAQGNRAFSASAGDSFSNITIIGNDKVSYGITVSGTKEGTDETITIDGCSFENCDYGVYSDEVTNLEKLVIKDSTFKNCDYATILYTENSEFTGNTVDNGKLNIMHDGQKVTGNTFKDDSRIKFYTAAATFERNNISSDSYLDANTGVSGIDISENYWGGGAPSDGQLRDVSVTGNDVYYKDPSMDEDDLNTYVPPYTVTVDCGNGSKWDKTYEEGASFKFPEAPTRAGYIFMGWSWGGSSWQPGESVTVTGDMYVRAVWANMPDIGPDKPDEEPEPPAALPFADVAEGAWYYDAVKAVYEAGLMKGVTDTSFDPDGTLTRAMIWTILARADGVDTEGGSSWYSKAQAWAVSKGVSDGENAMGEITREQLVTMLWRLNGEPVIDYLMTAPDAGTISSWAYEAMRWAAGVGLIQGDEAGRLEPTATATRAEAATFLVRYLTAG